MEYKHLGRTGLQVSRLALGTMNFGELTDELTSFEIMDKALDAGINFFDTADVYGGPQRPDMEKGFGISEDIIGRWLAQGGRRDRIVLATKLYQPMETGPNDRGLSAYHIGRACEASLRRLQTDHIDLYQMHHVQRKEFHVVSSCDETKSRADQGSRHTGRSDLRAGRWNDQRSHR